MAGREGSTGKETLRLSFENKEELFMGDAKWEKNVMQETGLRKVKVQKCEGARPAEPVGRGMGWQHV